ncbi:hypothetical protein [Natronobiforma cellulositropha]|uniref:hypothetical protein n=1 Tax=Natronobiforma cellulositropha TaxID=1679076 RepID=UPI0021D5E44A|nr:hypothetical protein [Natronobiforma cellulositropha]
MSTVNDTIRLLKGEFVVFAFLPTINYCYIYWNHPNPGSTDVALVFGAIFTSAVGFNILTQVNFEAYTSSGEVAEDEELPNHSGDAVLGLQTLVVLILATLLWFVFLISSVVELWFVFTGESYFPGLLIVISVLVICLIASDLLLTKLLPNYD